MPLEVSSKHALFEIYDLKQGSLPMPYFIMTPSPGARFPKEEPRYPLLRMQTLDLILTDLQT